MDARTVPLDTGGRSSGTGGADLRALLGAGVALASERSFDAISDLVLTTGMRLTRAAYGGFVYNRVGESGDMTPVRHVRGVPGLEYSTAPVPEINGFFSGPFSESESYQTEVTSSPARSQTDHTLVSFAGIPAAHLGIKSCMTVRVRSRDKETLGSMLFAHTEPGMLSENVRSLLTILAAQAAAALCNARLAEGLAREIALADANRALQQETGRRLRQALDAGQLGTWSWNKDTDLLDLDERAAQILNTEPHKPVSRISLRASILSPDDLAATPEHLGEMLNSGGTYATEYRIDTPEGQRWVSSRGLTTVADDGQTVVGMTGTVQDITAQKTQEATLRQTEKLAATGRMAATIAHEINNPLEAVTNLIYLSKTDPSVPSGVQHLLNLADNELARVSQIAQQTLGFYRDTSHPVEIDLSQMLHGVADLFARKVQSRNLRIDMDVHQDLHIFGLQGEVRQVFSNLMVNAIDASTRGTIRVRARPRFMAGTGGVAVMICDEGTGIHPSIRHKLFAPFFTTKESVGTGLGLWVTRGIVEKSGGRVDFRSRVDPPTGTVFRVFFPSGKSGKDVTSSLRTTLLQ